MGNDFKKETTNQLSNATNKKYTRIVQWYRNIKLAFRWAIILVKGSLLIYIELIFVVGVNQLRELNLYILHLVKSRNVAMIELTYCKMGCTVQCSNKRTITSNLRCRS